MLWIYEWRGGGELKYNKYHLNLWHKKNCLALEKILNSPNHSVTRHSHSHGKEEIVYNFFWEKGNIYPFLNPRHVMVITPKASNI